MKYKNPIIKGFYPDPSVCRANGKYYLVCSTFHYFPGVPLFESDDLVNWKQIGHCLTRKSQIALSNIESSGGIFAPTIRHNNGRFYMVTTNATMSQHFYVWTDDIYGEWSDPITVDQNGIDPSLYFEDNRAYFMSNGSDDSGVGGIVQCEIDIETGRKLAPSQTVWQGTGGRFLESPHLYKIKEYYYLMAAEGGTEYGHMVTYARSKSPFGPFTVYENNPVLTNRNLGGFEIQGVGHGDLIEAPDGSYWILHLGFRQIGMWATYHHLGREVFLSPVQFDSDGWFTAGDKGTTTIEVEVPYVSIPQKTKDIYTFENTDWNIDWCYLRHPDYSKYELNENSCILTGSDISINDVDSPTFIGLRQKDFKGKISCNVSVDHGEAGITLYMDEIHHYDVALRQAEDSYEVIERLCIGDVKSIESIHKLGTQAEVNLNIQMDNMDYTFSVTSQSSSYVLGKGMTRYLSSEVAGGFTGVVIGLYAYSEAESNTARFKDFKCVYSK